MRLPLVAAAATIAALTFTGTASADNISVPVAKSKCRAYVQDVLNRTDYVEASFKATPAFPGHNHYVRCAVSYDTAATATKKYYAARRRSTSTCWPTAEIGRARSSCATSPTRAARRS
jgi:hypothetical protein